MTPTNLDLAGVEIERSDLLRHGNTKTRRHRGEGEVVVTGRGGCNRAGQAPPLQWTSLARRFVANRARTSHRPYNGRAWQGASWHRSPCPWWSPCMLELHLTIHSSLASGFF